ncbi:hypothetical protein [Streptosporangium fragile]|uniref:hypothetical protein n=1 Tax=Streptosporangium fragile TaxID=46186 RepID=UPI0031EA6647
MAASVCELVIVVVAFVLLSLLRRELAAGYENGDGADFNLEHAVSSVQDCVWAHAVAGVITLAVAGLARWRGGTVGVRTATGLSLIPYTVFYLLFGLQEWSALDMWHAHSEPRPSGHWYEVWYSDVFRSLTGAAGLLYLAGAALLFRTAPNRGRGKGRGGGTRDDLATDAVVDAPGRDTAVRGRRRPNAGRAVVCLVAASVCELVVAAGALILLPPLQRELEAQYETGDGVAHYLEWTVHTLQDLVWGYPTAGVITLAVAVMAWRRGGTAGVQAAAAAGLAPYTAFYLLLGLLGALSLNDPYVDRYSDMVLWLSSAAGLLYLAGAILLFRTGDVRQGGRLRTAEETGVAS